MNLTRLSLYYPVGYLFSGGLGLLVDPELALKLLFSTGHPDAAMVRLAGLLTVGLGILVLQVIRLNLDALYPTIIAVRVFFIAVYPVLYLQSGDPFFLTLAGMVGFGVVLSITAFLLDKGRRAS